MARFRNNDIWPNYSVLEFCVEKFPDGVCTHFFGLRLFMFQSWWMTGLIVEGIRVYFMWQIG